VDQELVTVKQTTESKAETLHRVDMTVFLENQSAEAVDRFMDALTDWVIDNGGGFFTTSSKPVDPETGQRLHGSTGMNRRGFLGSLAALVGARALKAEPTPNVLPSVNIPSVWTIDNNDARGSAITTTAYSGTGATYWVKLDPNTHAAGEGVDWNWTLR
jgi:hypothetical protein